jgi:phosphoesterase RecJ-like protein
MIMSARTESAQTVSPVPADVCEAIRTADRIALIGHVTPDADCMGVIGAMKLVAAQLGKTACVSMPPGSVSRKLQFMVGLGGWKPASPAELAACDLAMAMDTAKDKRVNVDGKLEALPDTKVLNVDHHASNTMYGDVNWVDGARSSACEMVYEIVRALDVKVTPAIATLLYAGIHNDTQGFSLSNTTPRSLQAAYELTEAGARVAETCEKLNRSCNQPEFGLLKTIYANTRVSDDGRLGWSTCNHHEIVGAGCTAEDIDDQVEIVRSIEGVRVAILFSEGRQGKIRMNFRGERGLPILELAKQFDGGGHEMAAGAIQDGSIAEVVERVLPAVGDYIAKHA